VVADFPGPEEKDVALALVVSFGVKMIDEVSERPGGLHKQKMPILCLITCHIGSMRRS
jgi:hypothetical protein